jgi:hypothetical protein
MPILRIIRREMGQELYDAASAAIDLDRQHPLGLIMHGAIETDGAMQIAQVWESEDYARRYDEEHLEPALRAVGAPLDAEVSIYELHHLVTP